MFPRVFAKLAFSVLVPLTDVELRSVMLCGIDVGVGISVGVGNGVAIGGAPFPGFAFGGLNILGLAVGGVPAGGGAIDGVAAGGVPGDGIAAGGGGPPAANTDWVKIFVADAATIVNKVNFIRITY